jgi:hypothetical protein
MTTDIATETAQVPAGSTPPDSNDVPPAASVPADAAPEPAVGSEAPQANGETSDTPSEPDAPEPARKPKPDRIKELIAERNFWRERAVAGTPAKKAETETPSVSEKPPSLEQHGFDTEKWSTAYTEWARADAARAVERHLAKVEETKQAASIAEQFAQRENEFATSTPEYVEAVSDPALQQYVTPTISDAIVTSPLGPQLSYHLATHREELATIAKMRPTQQAIALGKIEAKLETLKAAPKSAPKPKTVQQTRAPAPPTPVGNGSAPTKRPEDMSVAEYMEYRQRWANRS